MRLTLAAVLLLALAAPAQAQQRPRYDLDGDGRITKAEFRSVQIDQTMRLDRNGDGKLARTETRTVEAMIKTFGGKAAEARIASLWALADTDRDAIITRAEAGAAADKRFPVYDADKDGWLNAAEIEAVRKRSIGQR
ncbi:MAG TPA: hypothetical protein VEA79_07885 [Phenylobacterium sp.]|nr:hypothetical protein [Phenylobacterium sp.]